MLEMFVLVKIFHVYMYITMHQLLYFKYVQVIQFILCQLHLTETENKKSQSKESCGRVPLPGLSR